MSDFSPADAALDELSALDSALDDLLTVANEPLPELPGVDKQTAAELAELDAILLDGTTESYEDKILASDLAEIDDIMSSTKLLESQPSTSSLSSSTDLPLPSIPTSSDIAVVLPASPRTENASEPAAQSSSSNSTWKPAKRKERPQLPRKQDQAKAWKPGAVSASTTQTLHRHQPKKKFAETGSSVDSAAPPSTSAAADKDKVHVRFSVDFPRFGDVFRGVKKGITLTQLRRDRTWPSLTDFFEHVFSTLSTEQVKWLASNTLVFNVRRRQIITLARQPAAVCASSLLIAGDCGSMLAAPLEFGLLSRSQELRVRTPTNAVRTLRVDALMSASEACQKMLARGAKQPEEEQKRASAVVARLCLFMPPTEERLTARPTEYPDGRYLFPEETLADAVGPAWCMQWLAGAEAPQSPAFALELRKRALPVRISALEQPRASVSGAASSVVYIDPLVPLSETALARYCDVTAGGSAIGAWCSQRSPFAAINDQVVQRTHFLRGDRSLAYYFNAIGVPALTVSTGRWLSRCVSADGEWSTLSVRPSTTTFAQALRALLTAGAGGKGSRDHQSSVSKSLGIWLPRAVSTWAPPVDQRSFLDAPPPRCLWSAFGHWPDPEQTLDASRLFTEHRVLCVRSSHWRCSVLVSSSPAHQRTCLVHLNPMQLCSKALAEIVKHSMKGVAAGSGSSSPPVFCLYPYATAAGIHGCWLTGPRALKALSSTATVEATPLRMLYNECSDALHASRCTAEYQAGSAMSRAQWSAAMDRNSALPEDTSSPVLPVASWFHRWSLANDTGRFIVCPDNQLIRVQLTDDTSKTLSARTEEPVTTFLEQLCKKLGPSMSVGDVASCGFGLYSPSTGQWLELEQTLAEQGVGVLSATSDSSSNFVNLVFLRRCALADPAPALQHPVMRHLLYRQALGLVLSGAIRVPRVAAARLAALQMQSRWKDDPTNAHSQEFLKLSEFFDPSNRNDREIATEANVQHRSLRGMSSEDAESAYVACCASVPLAAPARFLAASGLRFYAELRRKAGLTKQSSVLVVDTEKKLLVVDKAEATASPANAGTAAASSGSGRQRMIPLSKLARLELSDTSSTGLTIKFASADSASAGGDNGSSSNDPTGVASNAHSSMSFSSSSASSAAEGVGTLRRVFKKGKGGGDEPVSSRVPGDEDNAASSKSKRERELVLNFQSLLERELFYRAVERARLPKAAAAGGVRLRLFAGTWNLGKAAPPPLTGWLGQAGSYDIIAIGTQEARYETSSSGSQDWLSMLRAHFGSAYSMIGQCKMWEIGMVLFVRRSIEPLISAIETSTKATGIAGIAGNKGAVAISFRVMQRSVCLVCAHLAARADLKRLQSRNDNFSEIIDTLNLGRRNREVGPGADLVARFDHVIWLGDLNYRIELTREALAPLIAAGDWASLYAFDQLRAEATCGRAFAAFSELRPRFRPTYRLERGANEYCTQTKQHLQVQNAPAFCDRVLWSSRMADPATRLLPLQYDAVHSMMSSDHRPVLSEFWLNVPGVPHHLDAHAIAFSLHLYDVQVHWNSDPGGAGAVLASLNMTHATIASINAASNMGNFYERYTEASEDPWSGVASSPSLTSSKSVVRSNNVAGASMTSKDSTDSGADGSALSTLSEELFVHWSAGFLDTHKSTALRRMEYADGVFRRSLPPLFVARSSLACIGPFLALSDLLCAGENGDRATVMTLSLSSNRNPDDDSLMSGTLSLDPSVREGPRQVSVPLFKGGRQMALLKCSVHLTDEQSSHNNLSSFFISSGKIGRSGTVI